MLVSQLRDYSEQYPVQILRAPAREVKINAQDLAVTIGETAFELEGSETLKAIGKFFKVPSTFLERIPMDLAEQNLRYFLEMSPDRTMAFEHDDHEVYMVHDGDASLLSRGDYVGVVEAIFDDDDEVLAASFHQGEVRVDVITEQLEVAPRPGDITRGGVRISGHLALSSGKPTVSSYLERLTCSNGNTIQEPLGVVPIKGRSLEEVIHEMELACARVLRHTPSRLETWESMAGMEVADPAQLVHRLMDESGVPAALEIRVIDRLPELEGNTFYDVVNLITSSWDMEGIDDRHIELLQAAGGHAIATAAQHRCPSCLSALGV